MAKSIKLTPKEWITIKDRLQEEYPRSVFLIREVSKRELGFTVREHREYFGAEDQFEYDINGSWIPYRLCICLDFYDDAKETFFRLKYL